VNAVDWWTGLNIKQPLNNSEVGIQSPVLSRAFAHASFVTSFSSGTSIYAPPALKSFGSSMSSRSSLMMGTTSTIYWNREKYIRSDFDMMNGFGLLALTTDGLYKIYQMSPDDADQAFGNLDGSYTFIGNYLGGGVSIPWTKLYHLYQTPSNLDMFRNLRDLQYANYPHGNRSIQFSYQAGNHSGSIFSKSFNY
jgi:hypothetical protein